MSKVVKSVGRAISGVVKGVVNTVKKVASSKLGKVLITAAAIYFGGAALAGGFGSSAAGGSFLSGMGTGVANAASGLSSAWTSALGGNFAEAGSALSSGFQGQAAGAAANAATAAGTSGTTAAMSGGFAPVSEVGATQVAAALPSAAAPAAGSLAEGMIGAAKISAGTQLVGGLIQGAGQQKAMQDQRNFELQQANAARDRYNANVGTNWWGDTSGAAGAPPAYAQPAPTGLIAGAMTPQQKYAEQMRQQLSTYSPYALPTRV